MILDDLSKFSTNISSIGFSILLSHRTNIIEISLVEMEKREIQSNRTGKRTFSFRTVFNADDYQCGFIRSSNDALNDFDEEEISVCTGSKYTY